MKKVALALAVTGFSLASCVDGAPPETTDDMEPEVTGEAQQAVISYCPYVDPGSSQFVPLAFPIDFDAEMVITDVNVVDDACRTTWSGPCPGGATQGAWTFGNLMTQMAGAIPPQQFVADWLDQWENPIVVNGFATPPPGNIRPAFIDNWLVLSGCSPGDPIVGSGACPLDLQQAPFRLLAIVNRADLECAGYTGPGVGEARFVFGVVDLAGNPLQATVILEYKLPPKRFGAARTAIEWEQDWHKLSDPTWGGIGTLGYSQYLEDLLTDITSPGMMPGGPNNGSAIGQVRTNEIDFSGFWALREATLQLTGGGPSAMPLLFTPTAETPHDSLNLTGPLDGYLVSESLASGNMNLSNFTQTPIPVVFPGGESTAPFLWDHSVAGTLLPIERHHFGFNTCNGCHTLETTTPFVHISPRPAGLPATLSPFLDPTSPGPGAPGTAPLVHNVPDPAGSGHTFVYGEPFRRECELTRMLGHFPKCHTRGNGAH